MVKCRGHVSLVAAGGMSGKIRLGTHIPGTLPIGLPQGDEYSSRKAIECRCRFRVVYLPILDKTQNRGTTAKMLHGRIMLYAACHYNQSSTKNTLVIQKHQMHAVMIV